MNAYYRLYALVDSYLFCILYKKTIAIINVNLPEPLFLTVQLYGP